MSVVEVNPNRVITHRLDAFRAEPVWSAAGEDGQGIPGDFLPEFPSIRGGAHPSEPCRRIEDGPTIRPLDGEPLIAIEVKVARWQIDGHGRNGTVRSDHAVKVGRPS